MDTPMTTDKLIARKENGIGDWFLDKVLHRE